MMVYIYPLSPGFSEVRERHMFLRRKKGGGRWKETKRLKYDHSEEIVWTHLGNFMFVDARWVCQGVSVMQQDFLFTPEILDSTLSSAKNGQ